MPACAAVDLAPVFAQLRRDQRQPDRSDHLLLGAPADPPSPPEDAVLVDLEALLLRHPADCDVVRLGAGEVVERRPEALGRDDAEVDLETRFEPDRRPALTLLEDLANARSRGEGRDRLCRGSGFDQEVEVTH